MQRQKEEKGPLSGVRGNGLLNARDSWIRDHHPSISSVAHCNPRSYPEVLGPENSKDRIRVERLSHRSRPGTVNPPTKSSIEVSNVSQVFSIADFSVTSFG